MIFQETQEVDVSDAPSGKKMTIKEKNADRIIAGLSRGMYSDPIGTIVREIVSNGFDAHQELGVSDDVLVEMKDPCDLTGEAGFIAIRDFGTGIDEWRMENVYCSYGESTKRDTNEEIGGFGVGGKSPLAYASSYQLTTWVDGHEYQYIIYESKDGNIPDLVHKTPSTERRGTEVRIAIKTYEDAEKFREALCRQLRYFEGVSFIGDCDMDNDYQLIKGKHFIVRTNDEYTTNMGVCIGKIHYPLDASLFGIKDHETKGSISLYFGIGEIDVTMTRESIRYTYETRLKIKERMAEAAEELSKLRESSLKDETDLLTYIKTHRDNSSVVLNGENYPVPSCLMEKMDLKEWQFKDLKGLNLISIKENPFERLFHFRAFVKDGVSSTRKIDTTIRECIQKDRPIYRAKESMSKYKDMYISEEFENSFFVVAMSAKLKSDPDFCKSYFRHVGNYEDLVEATSREDAKQEFDRQFKQYLKVVGRYLIAHSESYDEVEVPEEWIDDYKKNRFTPERSRDEITLRLIKPRNNWSAPSFRLYKRRVSDIIDECRANVLVVYGYQGEESELDLVRKNLQKTLDYDKYMVFKISKVNARRYLRGEENCYHWSQVEEHPIMKGIEKRNKVASFCIPYIVGETELRETGLITEDLYSHLDQAYKWYINDCKSIKGSHWFSLEKKNAHDYGVFSSKYGMFVEDILEKLEAYAENNRDTLNAIKRIDKAVRYYKDSEVCQAVKDVLKTYKKPFNLYK
ncbi:hypothetical protein PP178_04100 [Zeaxanthinibacter sp. PT1]|uniref:hypothetical protein n=1 Tax=Zeaxanthinibacter TaxID=561554 RepID=UPI00234A8D2A|nr:hypothetical protein [Zeaxanthinibacter sp. PT1]MDC6350723.1 hypothetical protein [Zeaxanthinibacter sp. PT1]